MELSKDCDKVIIIGGKNSSNTKELAKIAKENCSNAYLVQSFEEVKNIAFSKNDRVCVLAGASTPLTSIKEVVEYLNKINN